MTQQMEQAATLRYVQGKSYGDIGKIMGLTCWQAAHLVKKVDAFMAGFAAGFRTAMAVRRGER